MPSTTEKSRLSLMIRELKSELMEKLELITDTHWELWMLLPLKSQTIDLEFYTIKRVDSTAKLLPQKNPDSN